MKEILVEQTPHGYIVSLIVNNIKMKVDGVYRDEDTAVIAGAYKLEQLNYKLNK